MQKVEDLVVNEGGVWHHKWAGTVQCNTTNSRCQKFLHGRFGGGRNKSVVPWCAASLNCCGTSGCQHAWWSTWYFAGVGALCTAFVRPAGSLGEGF